MLDSPTVKDLEEADSVMYDLDMDPDQDDNEFVNYGSVCEADELYTDEVDIPLGEMAWTPAQLDQHGVQIATFSQEEIDREDGSAETSVGTLLSDTFHTLDKDLHDQPLVSQLRSSLTVPLP